MKQVIKRILLVTFALLFALSLAACEVDFGDDEDDEPDKDYTGNETEIKVSVYAAGFGDGWIDQACKLYEEQHPEYRFKIRANSSMFDTVKTELTSGTCTSDVVLVAGYDYLNLATTGKLAELSSVYNSVIPDSDKTVREVVSEEQYSYRLTGADKDKIYGIPWQDSGANGFVYNKKMFTDNGWQIPRTMDEFFALCDKIAEKNVAPLVYGGGQQDGYVIMTPETWLVQYYGYEYMQNTFENYESPEQYKYTEAGRLKAYKTLARMLKGKTSNGKNIALTGSKSFTAQAAQREFIKGNAAMVICGAWFPTEMKSLLKDYPDFEFGYIPLPHINADKKTADGADSSNETYSLAANLLCVPASAPHADVAEDFLLSMFTKESYTTFVKENNGATRPINVQIDESVLNDFSRPIFERASASKASNKCVYEVSQSPMAINGYLGLMNFGGADQYLAIINSQTYEDALNVAEAAAQGDYQTALSFWDSRTNNWDSKYLTIV